MYSDTLFATTMFRKDKDVYAIDKKNGNILGEDTIKKEMENVKISFQIKPEGKKPPNGSVCQLLCGVQH